LIDVKGSEGRRGQGLPMAKMPPLRKGKKRREIQSLSPEGFRGVGHKGKASF